MAIGNGIPATVFSWINPDKPGYVYPEIIGYYVKLLSYFYLIENDERLITKAETSANFLKTQLSQSGGVSRDGIQYVFDSGIMPSTGTLEPGGLSWYQVINLLKKVAGNKQIVGFDVVELRPGENKAPDFLAAKLIYRMLSMVFSERDKA